MNLVPEVLELDLSEFPENLLKISPFDKNVVKAELTGLENLRNLIVLSWSL